MPQLDTSEKLKSLRVTNLFGRFNHNLSFHEDEDEDVSIITAPNGYGKTVILRVIDAIFNLKFSYFSTLEFDEILISFKSGISLVIYKESGELFDDETESSHRQVLFKAIGLGEDISAYKLTSIMNPRDLQRLERALPIERMGNDKWMDFATESVFNTNEIIERYASQLPNNLKSKTLPDWLKNIINSVQVHLVETQRLLSLEEIEDIRSRHHLRSMAPSSVVEKDASDLTERIGAVLKRYANEAQILDQSFPKRIIEFREGDIGNEQTIRNQLQELGKKREELVSAGLIGSTISEPIQPSDIFEDESVRRILSIYVDDTTKKLGIFDEIYARIRLFKQILDEHFSFKNISIDPNDGIRAFDEDTKSLIPLSSLSSGEQHELVLIYELLFKVQEGSVILIDEPELSLHVAWQKTFISDIQKIQKLKNLNVIIATHSPQIINDKWELVQELTAS